MAAQQVQFAETIRAMKLALRRQRDPSPPSSLDGGDDIANHPVHTNRGNKLRHGARYVREGQLDTTGGQAYKRKVSHAGYDRYIIAKKPKLYDADGDVVDPNDIPSDVEEGDEQMYGEAVDEDPFGQVHLESLLRPLTSAAELPHHPSLSVAYTSRALTQMAEEAAEMVRRERASLWKAKRLLARFRGDGGWMSCEKFETDQDEWLLRGEGDGEAYSTVVPSIAMDEMPLALMENGVGSEHPPSGDEAVGLRADETMDGVEAQDHVEESAHDNGVPEAHTEPTTSTTITTNGINAEPHPTNGSPPANNPTLTDLQHDASAFESASNSASGTNIPSHAMTTRARARSPQPHPSPSPSPSTSSLSIPTIHPWFLTPPTSLPDRDLSLPFAEAEDTRKLLLLYVQKQENVVRQMSSLYEGLQRTDRLRREVIRACRAEAHVESDGRGGVRGTMSDGEDWYDVEEWGLSGELGELEKGKDEVEDLAEEEGRRVGGRRRRVVGR